MGANYVLKLPVILILHLKFFEYSHDRCAKIIKALDFEFDLKIDSTLVLSETQSPTEKQCKLFAVVYHEGKNANIGHYVTDAFHVGHNCWIRYDDSSVKTVQEEYVLKPQGTRVPYLLFYRKSEMIRSK
ncbi:ubiquitin carboxyl-terminal hydrolase 10-like [Leptinotarsa decemlineata]|uniref:ubiquitin carboxyl-terminal hydrolase 10-like n=1 Tax=Leptinotarsa decemlineata TaxID=7539 RepID=UPI003D30CF9C